MFIIHTSYSDIDLSFNSVSVRITRIISELHVVHHIDDIRRQRVTIAGHMFAGNAERFRTLGLRRRRRIRGSDAPESAQQQRVIAVRAERVPQQQLRYTVRQPAAGQSGSILGQHAVPGPAGHDGPAGPITARPRLSQPSAQQTRGRLVRNEPGYGRAVATGRRVRHCQHHGL